MENNGSKLGAIVWDNVFGETARHAETREN